MRLPAFEVMRPATVAEAIDLMAANPGAMLVSGGTDLYPNMKRRQVAPGAVVSLAGVEGLDGVEETGDGVRIGAGTRLAALASSPLAPPALARAASEVASPQIRNVATVGGNLCVDTRCNYINMTPQWRAASGSCLKDGGETCWVAPRGGRCVAVSSSDLAPAAIALDAKVRLVGPDGERQVELGSIYQDDGLDHLGKSPEEVLIDLFVPKGLRGTYRKLRRRGAIDFPILGVGAAIRTGKGGAVEEARVVLGAVSPAPFRADEAESILVGERLEPEVIERAAASAAKLVRPYDNTDLGARYRKWMAAPVVARALRDLA